MHCYAQRKDAAPQVWIRFLRWSALVAFLNPVGAINHFSNSAQTGIDITGRAIP